MADQDVPKYEDTVPIEEDIPKYEETAPIRHMEQGEAILTGLGAGLPLGISDTTSALAGALGYRHGLPEGMSDPKDFLDRYYDVKKQILAERQQAEQDYPKSSLAAQTVGSTLSSIPLLGAIGLGPVAANATKAQKYINAAKAGGALGAGYGLGGSTGQLLGSDADPLQVAKDTALGTAAGAALGPLAEALPKSSKIGAGVGAAGLGAYEALSPEGSVDEFKQYLPLALLAGSVAGPVTKKLRDKATDLEIFHELGQPFNFAKQGIPLGGRAARKGRELESEKTSEAILQTIEKEKKEGSRKVGEALAKGSSTTADVEPLFKKYYKDALTLPEDTEERALDKKKILQMLQKALQGGQMESEIPGIPTPAPRASIAEPGQFAAVTELTPQDLYNKMKAVRELSAVGESTLQTPDALKLSTSLQSDLLDTVKKMLPESAQEGLEQGSTQMNKFLNAQEMLKVTPKGAVTPAEKTRLENTLGSFIRGLDQEGSTAQARQKTLKDTVAQLQEVAPEFADYLKTHVKELSERFELAKKMGRSGIGRDVTGLLGTVKGMALNISDTAGRAAYNMSKANSNINNAIENAGPAMGRAGYSVGKTLSPYAKDASQMASSVSAFVSNATPDTVKALIPKVSAPYQQVLAKIADPEMAEATRRALLFSLLQQPAFRESVGDIIGEVGSIIKPNKPGQPSQSE